MSDVKRYTVDEGFADRAEDGDYVLASDYDALSAKCEELERRLAEERDRITAIIRDLYTHANETIDPEDLLRLIEVIEGKHTQQPTERDDDE